MGDLLKDFNIDSFREGNRFEAKLAKGGFPKSLWETYSSFANTDGGLILLGVKENRDHSFTIEGVENPEHMEKLFWDNVNNKKVVNINILSNSDVEVKEISSEPVKIDLASVFKTLLEEVDKIEGMDKKAHALDLVAELQEIFS